MFEHKTDPLLPWPAFLRRLATSATLGLALIGFVSGADRRSLKLRLTKVE